MKIYGTAKGGALSKKDFGVAFGGGAVEYNKFDSETTENVSLSTDKLTATATGTNQQWGKIAWSTGTYNPSSGTSFVEFEVTSDTLIGGFGLATNPSGFGNDHMNDADWTAGMYLVGNGNASINYISIAEGGTEVDQTAQGFYTTGDTFKITMDESGVCRYYKNGGSPFYTSGNTASGDNYFVIYPYETNFGITVTDST